MSATTLGLLQATDRSGAVVARLNVLAWPVIVGRALTSDLVLDDSHVAAEHLRLDRTPEGAVEVRVVAALNGVSLQHSQHAPGQVFVWPAGNPLTLGRLKLGLRLADEPLEGEEPLPLFPWRAVGWTLLALFSLLALVVLQSWLTLSEPQQLARALPGLLAVTFVTLIVWAGLWALATKLFTSGLQFWRHLRIACATLVAVQALVVLVNALAFMFSLESLARFETQLDLLGLVAAIYFHLTVIVTQRRRGLAGLMAGLAVAGIVVMLGTSWIQNKRFSNSLYMSTLFPPAWRMAPTVPVKEFVEDTQNLRQRLDERLKDQDDDNEGDQETEAE